MTVFFMVAIVLAATVSSHLNGPAACFDDTEYDCR